MRGAVSGDGKSSTRTYNLTIAMNVTCQTNQYGEAEGRSVTNLVGLSTRMNRWQFCHSVRSWVLCRYWCSWYGWSVDELQMPEQFDMIKQTFINNWTDGFSKYLSLLGIVFYTIIPIIPLHSAMDASLCVNFIVLCTSWRIGDRIFAVATPYTQNRQPTDLKLLQLTDSLHCKLKTHLFTNFKEQAD